MDCVALRWSFSNLSWSCDVGPSTFLALSSTGPSRPGLAPGVNGAPKRSQKFCKDREKIPCGAFGAPNAAASGVKSPPPSPS